MTEFNNICRKPHWPRERGIRWLLTELGVKLPPHKKEVLESEDESSAAEEQSESEGQTTDGEVEVDPDQTSQAEPEKHPEENHGVRGSTRYDI